MKQERTAEEKTGGDTRHAFDHIGPAPYRYLGYEAKTYQACPGAPVQVGGSCDHCGTGIIDTFYFVAADGTKFHVGSSCVQKAGDKGLYSQIQSTVNQIKRERKAEADKKRIAAAWVLIDCEEDGSASPIRRRLEAQAHPMGFTDRQTGAALTLADWADWMMAHSGTSGRIKVARVIEKEAKG